MPIFTATCSKKEKETDFLQLCREYDRGIFMNIQPMEDKEGVSVWKITVTPKPGTSETYASG